MAEVFKALPEQSLLSRREQSVGGWVGGVDNVI